MGALIWFLIIAIVAFGILYMRNSALKLSREQPTDSENVIILTDQNFRKTIEKGVSLVDFWAPWCMPCKIQGPVVNQVADELKGKAKICKLNVDEQKSIAASMKIRNIPNIIIFKDGKAVKQLIGVKPRHTLLKAVQSVLD